MDSAGVYADLQYIRNKFSEKAGIGEMSGRNAEICDKLFKPVWVALQ